MRSSLDIERLLVYQANAHGPQCLPSELYAHIPFNNVSKVRTWSTNSFGYKSFARFRSQSKEGRTMRIYRRGFTLTIASAAIVFMLTLAWSGSASQSSSPQEANKQEITPEN